MPFVEPLDAYFEPWGEFVEVGNAGHEVSIKGIWEEDFHEISSQYVSVSSSGPSIVVKTSDADLYNLDSGVRLVRKNKTYRVQDRHDDGAGLTDLFLSRA